MTFKNEILKFAAFASAVGCAGAGVAAVMSGFAPAALGAGILAGAAGNGWLSLDKIGTLEDEKDALNEQLQKSQETLTAIETELKARLAEIIAERDALKSRLEEEIASIRTRCETFREIVELYETGVDPSFLELPAVKSHVEGLKQQLKDKVQELKETRLELLRITQENEEIRQDADEVHSRNEELDQELADLKNEHLLLSQNFEREVQLKLYERLQPYTSQAVALAIQEKLAEIDTLRGELNRSQEKLAENQKIMEAIHESMIPDIEKTFAGELSQFDSRIINLSRENTILQQRIDELEAPRRFPGLTEIDATGNQIIDHFAQYDVTFDAHSTEVIPGGFNLKFRVDRNPSTTKLSVEEFSKILSQRGLMGLSMRPLVFSFDQINFIVSVQIFPGFEPCPGHDRDMTGFVNNGSLSTVGGLLTKELSKPKPAKTKTGKGNKTRTRTGHEPDTHRDKFVALGCYPADQFSEVVRQKFVNRVRICAGSTGGKSPILERVAVELARLNDATLWLLNPIPGSKKDWFKVPGIVQPGMDADRVIGAKIEEYHAEFKRRRNDLVKAGTLEQMVLALDEDNSTARNYEEIGKFLKDMYQLSDHVGQGLVTAGQGLNISGLSGGSKPRKGEDGEKNTGNATKLMAEDWQNVVLVLMSDQVPAHVGKKTFKAPKQRTELLETWDKLTQLCDELNELEGLIDRPLLGDEKKVSPNAYRVAMVDAPSHPPFFIQLPAYGDFSLEGLRFPAGAKVTTQHELEDVEDDLAAEAFLLCPHCEGPKITRSGHYSDGAVRFRCNHKGCRKSFRIDG